MISGTKNVSSLLPFLLDALSFSKESKRKKIAGRFVRKTVETFSLTVNCLQNLLFSSCPSPFFFLPSLRLFSISPTIKKEERRRLETVSSSFLSLLSNSFLLASFLKLIPWKTNIYPLLSLFLFSPSLPTLEESYLRRRRRRLSSLFIFLSLNDELQGGKEAWKKDERRKEGPYFLSSSLLEPQRKGRKSFLPKSWHLILKRLKFLPLPSFKNLLLFLFTFINYWEVFYLLKEKKLDPSFFLLAIYHLSYLLLTFH